MHVKGMFRKCFSQWSAFPNDNPNDKSEQALVKVSIVWVQSLHKQYWNKYYRMQTSQVEQVDGKFLEIF